MNRTRRGLALGTALAVIVVGGSAVLAQGPEAREGHPILGSWILDATPADPQDQPEMFSFHVDGAVRGAGPTGASVGAWEPTGERIADVTAHYFLSDADGAFQGLGTVRLAVEVSEDGQTFSGTYTFEPSTAIAEGMGLPAGELGPGEFSAQRITVEPMGEPVAPLPDPGVPAVPGPGSPVPGASPVVLEVSPPAGTLPLPDPGQSPAA